MQYVPRDRQAEEAYTKEEAEVMPMGHSIPEDAKNSDLQNLINEYVRLTRDRKILEDHWFGGLSFYQISSKYDISLTTVKNVIYKTGDKILLKLN